MVNSSKTFGLSGRLLLVLLTICFSALPAQGQYGGGSGTAENPYQIWTAAQMNAIGANQVDWDKHFILMADIDLASFTGTSFNIIGYYVSHWDRKPFTGVFDGNGHTISNFTYISTGTSYIGLFAYVGGLIKDLGLIEPNVDAGGYVGSLVGILGGGTVTNCYIEGGSVSGTGWFVGGLVGYTSRITITNCSSSASVSGDRFVGGLIGSYSANSDFSNCYSTGSVTGDYRVGGLVGNSHGIITNSYSTASVSGRDQVGGLVGKNYYTISNCYSTGSVSGVSNVGGLVGYSDDDSGQVYVSFWDIESSGQTTSAPDLVGGGTGKTTAEMQEPNTFMDAGWDFVGQPDGPHDIWAEPAGGGYPILWWQLPPFLGLPSFSGGSGEPNDPYLIPTATELNRIGHNPRLMAAHFKLTNDIDLTELDFYIIGGSDIIRGSELFPFTGVFEGNGHTISNFTYNASSLSYRYYYNIGLFGYVGGLVKDLGLIDPNVDGAAGWLVGSLAGRNNGTITNCYAEGGSVSGRGYVGGLVGHNGGTITNCYATGSVSGNRYGGGLVGYNWGGEVTNSFWDTQTSGQATSAGGTGKTTAEMQMMSTFTDAGWDFTTPVWTIDEGVDYPRLWLELAPDLVARASDISFVPDSPVEPGTIIVVSAEVHNVGTKDANSFVVRFFNGDPDSGGIQIGSDQEITYLAGGGASEVVSVAFTSSPEPQSYEIFVLADATSQIEERNEANNRASRVLTAGPDLGLTSSDISFSSDVAGELRITVEVHNVGKGDITESIEVAFYNGDPETGGTYIGDATLIGGIAEGLSGIVEYVEWSNPPLGTYDIYVVVDPEGEIIEISKANNKAFNILSATLDLTLISEDISFNPEAAILGQEIEISAYVHNTGFLACEEFLVKFYDGDPDAGGTELGAEIVDRIAGLGSMQVSILFTFTSGGKHEIYVWIDGNNEVEETNEDNNINSNSLYVQYATIQEAIDAASPGDTVYIGPGTYNENVLINKSIILIGAGSATTIIDGGGTDDVVLVTADNVTIKGFTVQNSIGDGSGIHLQASGANVSENIITQCYYGIFCDYSSGSYIAHNTVTANSYGIYCEYASGDAIRYNTITNNTLYGAKSYNSTLANCFNYNYFSGNPVGYSYDPEEPVGPLLFGDNVLQDNEIGIEVKETSDSDLEFSDNTIVGSDIGISCENANPLIRGNALSSNTTAIYLVNSSSPTIEENTISENNTGIVHDESSEPILTDNTMTGNVENVNIIPVAICQDVTVAADDNCQGIVAPEDVDNGSYDSDGDSLSLSLDPSAPYDIGTTSVTLTVSDGMATASCQATVTVLTAPSVTYDGNTLLSTGGNPTVGALLVATLSAAYTEEVTFTLTAEGVETIVVTTNSIAGVASAVQALEPAIYKVEVTLKCSEATAIGILVVYNPEGGFATGGGWIVPEADGLNTHPNVRANFGFNAKYKQDSPTGHIEFRYSDGHIDLKSSSIEQLVITGGKIVQFKGWASVNKEQGHRFFVKAIDNGEPGINNDTFDIKVWAPGVSEEGNPTERAGGILQGGNIVVHTKG